MAGFLLRRLAGYLALGTLATFLAYAAAAATFNPLERFATRSPPPPPPPQTIANLRRDLLLDEPIPVRFLTWASGVVRGDFGQTITGQPVVDELWSRVGVSLRLFLIGTVVGIVLGVAIGVVGAVRRHRVADQAGTLLSFLVLSTPVFLLGILLQFAAIRLNDAAGATLLPFTGETTPGFRGGPGAAVLDRVQHLVLPTIAIALTQVALYSRYQRAAMLDVLGSDYLRTARAKGLTHGQAVVRHGLRTALIPMGTLFAFGFGLLVAGGVYVERIFSWYGMGHWFVRGVQVEDINIVAAVTLFVAVLVIVSGWLSDLLYTALDPRIRLG